MRQALRSRNAKTSRTNFFDVGWTFENPSFDHSVSLPKQTVNIQFVGRPHKHFSASDRGYREFQRRSRSIARAGLRAVVQLVAHISRIIGAQDRCASAVMV